MIDYACIVVARNHLPPAFIASKLISKHIHTCMCDVAEITDEALRFANVYAGSQKKHVLGLLLLLIS
jgi:hypothetical protein